MLYQLFDYSAKDRFSFMGVVPWVHLIYLFLNIAILLAFCPCPGTSLAFQDPLKINITDAERHSSALLKLLITSFPNS